MSRIGLVLGGGGLTGTAFHAGVLTALADAGWDARSAEVIVGTSAGSTSAALLRAGFPPGEYVRRVAGEPVSAEAERVLERIGRIREMPKRPRWVRRPAAPQLLRQVSRSPWRYRWGTILAAALPAGTVDVAQVSPGFGPLFERWPERPMWISTVRLTDGQRVLFGRDAQASVADAVAASCAIPGYFTPVWIRGVPYVDGGAHSIHSAEAVAALGLDLVIVSAPLATADPAALEVGNVPRVVVRRQLDREVTRLRATGTRVLVFAPDRALRSLMGMATMDLARRPAVARAAMAYATGRIGGRRVR
jgi:NTE family protein